LWTVGVWLVSNWIVTRSDALPFIWLTEKSHAKTFDSVKRECLAAGMAIVQEGDDEGIFTFDPSGERRYVWELISHVRE
jgi:hypothetical protein